MENLPGEVREGLVRVGHAVHVLSRLHGVAFAAVSGHELAGEAFGHGAAFLGASGLENPAPHFFAWERK